VSVYVPEVSRLESVSPAWPAAVPLYVPDPRSSRAKLAAGVPPLLAAAAGPVLPTNAAMSSAKVTISVAERRGFMSSSSARGRLRLESDTVSPFARPDLFWSTEQTAAKLRDPQVRIVDCRFTFEGDAHPEYLGGHLPGAVHCDWARDLSAPPPASGHPRWMLQAPDAFARTMSRFGIGNDTTVLGYDAEGGHHAARLWLALRRFGHDKMAVMEGGIQKWLAEGRPLEKGETTVAPATFIARPRDGLIATKD